MSDLTAVLAQAEAFDVTTFTDVELAHVSLAGIAARKWYADPDAVLADDVAVADIAAALVLGPRADAELLRRNRPGLAAFFVRHATTPDAEQLAEQGVSRLVHAVAVRLAVEHRQAIEAEEATGGSPRATVDAAVAAQLVETVAEIIDPDPATAFIDAAAGRTDHIVTATAHDLMDAGRKRRTERKRAKVVHRTIKRTAPRITEDPEPDRGPQAMHPLLARVPAAIARLRRSGGKLNKKTLAAELGVSATYLRRIRSRQPAQ